jgi:hypothetical protein
MKNDPQAERSDSLRPIRRPKRLAHPSVGRILRINIVLSCIFSNADDPRTITSTIINALKVRPLVTIERPDRARNRGKKKRVISVL